ncbi:spermatogenesis-associated protein 25 isoform X2 [Cebus imitator]|uniref:Spermatogenesis-associated protein 25 isoform X2 n=1 Tax=Sapajus apella TaxID=9515 RepID=A0A6J3GNK2_SAPAP|nr:spermatogenesis-associated protein 25 isoform X2 [Cebus imitator]XP_032119471.1 spermatogenesis-associated protein 25 isoform X2 [Sapajus apella]
MSYFRTPQTHPGPLSSGQGGAASPGLSLGLCSPVEPAVVASGGTGPASQKTEQVAPTAQAWGPALAMPQARGCPGGISWETLRRKEYSQYCHKFPHTRQLESLGWENGYSRSRAPEVLPVPSEAMGKEASSQPDICILTLAMMIAGIPTVPVPGVREEDLIWAAQAFMMAHPEPEGAGEGGQWEQVHAHTASGKVPLLRSKRGQPPGSCL